MAPGDVHVEDGWPGVPSAALKVIETLVWFYHLWLFPKEETEEKVVVQRYVEDDIVCANTCSAFLLWWATPLTSFDFGRRKTKAHLAVFRVLQWKVFIFTMELRGKSHKGQGRGDFQEGSSSSLLASTNRSRTEGRMWPQEVAQCCIKKAY